MGRTLGRACSFTQQVLLSTYLYQALPASSRRLAGRQTLTKSRQTEFETANGAVMGGMGTPVSDAPSLGGREAVWPGSEPHERTFARDSGAVGGAEMFSKGQWPATEGLSRKGGHPIYAFQRSLWLLHMGPGREAG